MCGCQWQADGHELEKGAGRSSRSLNGKSIGAHFQWINYHHHRLIRKCDDHRVALNGCGWRKEERQQSICITATSMHFINSRDNISICISSLAPCKRDSPPTNDFGMSQLLDLEQLPFPYQPQPLLTCCECGVIAQLILEIWSNYSEHQIAILMDPQQCQWWSCNTRDRGHFRWLSQFPPTAFPH